MKSFFTPEDVVSQTVFKKPWAPVKKDRQGYYDGSMKFLAKDISVKGVEVSPESPQPPSGQPSELFFNRELSYLAFNERVLAQANDPKWPVLERLKFWVFHLPISMNFSKRVCHSYANNARQAC